MRKLTKTAAVVAAMATMAMGATVMAGAAQNGWVQSGSNWYFYVNGEAVEDQWAKAGEKWYFLGEDGKMVTSTFVYDNEEVDDIDEISDGTDLDTPYYYVDSTGAMVTGWKKIDVNALGGSTTPSTDNNWYYFGGSGEMFAERWVQAGEKWYYLGTDGQMVENNYDADGKYYLGEDGVMISGWYKLTDDDDLLGVEDSWVYADDDEIIENGWRKISGKWYYFGNEYRGKDGVVSDVLVVESTVTGSGVNLKNNPDYSANTMVKDGFVTLRENCYYLDSNGAMKTGFFSVTDEASTPKKSRQYYASSEGIVTLGGKVKTINSKNYYFFGADVIGDKGVEYRQGECLRNKDNKWVVANENKGAETDDNGMVCLYDTKDEAKKSTTLTGELKAYKLGSSTTYSFTK